MTTNPGAPKPSPAATARASSWAVAGVRAFDGTLGSLVPAVFPAYARVFHPAYRKTAKSDATPVRWSEIAATHERTMHALAQWHPINPPQGKNSGHTLDALAPRPGVWDDEPVVGALPSSVVTRLSGLLTRHTTTPGRCWLAIWEGYGDLDPRWRTAPSFDLPGRLMHLLAGPVAAAAFPLNDRPGAEPFRNLHPNLWWPADRAWCVATDVDMMTTYVGGSVAAIEALTGDPGLEALAATADDRVTWNSDTVNRTTGG
ncbi:hypothetical protein NN3_64800 [Nocardia neocaledoniensis NBRC 108232]|uniref:Uncharacterized protein n=1 Tax=Nocardia neocaledoniensis TaxID=236511 RepID=A0A317NGI3_9NOCA|nr:hypothetical protein [Nocardia neocaledoniensis]PWV74506.1 hypothetical protein DFR69_106317 [Nocardia neocaledoniensis]GEM35473.1 hypothetical protein NN3_64800 [Nocardia neocaledoniensis NBRC 108232]